MNLIVKKTISVKGKAAIPGSKSQSIRALLLALLAKGESTIGNLLDSDDTQAAQAVCKALGAEIKTSASQFCIKSNGFPLISRAAKIYTGNSGITTLFTLALLGLRKDFTIPLIVDCGEQMRVRPIHPLVETLRDLGMVIEYIEHHNKLPLSVTGKLKGGTAEINGFNSQYLSALLISLPCAENDSVIKVRNLHERPYVNMTLSFLNKQGIRYTHHISEAVDTFIIQGSQQYASCHYTIPGDFSSASCLIAGSVLLPGEVELHGLDIKDAQGDKRLITILQQMGAEIKIKNGSIQIQGNKPLTGIRINANDIPDLVPALAVIATQASGKTDIFNVSQARIKETDRIHSMTEGLKKMGVSIEEHADGMTIYQSRLQGAFVNGYNDHRTVMALTIAGLIAEGTTIITGAESINKTYPQFIETLQTIGANVKFEKFISAKHIILIGFKHVGKTVIGQHLAIKLNKKFIDLDKELEKSYKEKCGEFLSCRQIMQTQGQQYYRELESIVLKRVIRLDYSVISLGGGTLLNELNQQITRDHILLHIDAPPGVVFERIMVEGYPAFFDPNKDPYESFNYLWNERNKIYKKLTKCIIDNSTTVEQAVNQALIHLDHQESANHHV